MANTEPRPIVGIFAHQPTLDGVEAASLRQCSEILAAHPLHLIHPEGMDTKAYKRVAPNLVLDPIPPEYLSSLRAYNRLKVTPWLYERYSEFDYFLTYELDAWVFRDELIQWCSEGFDYIGAPWFVGHYRGKPGADYLGVGNSGFSLRKISSVRKVFQSRARLTGIPTATRQWIQNGLLSPRYFLWWLQRFSSRNRFEQGKHDFPDNEDVFWGELTPNRIPWFHVAPVEKAKKFAFELYPSRMYRENDNELPFGCHKFVRNEPQFWKRFIPCFD